MREILFRGKRLDNGEWVRGFYVRLYDHKGHESHRIYTGYAETDCGDFYPDWWDVDPATIGQFIGQIDKNGKRIFEGDILRYKGVCNGCYKVYRYEVIYYDTFAMWMLDDRARHCGSNGMYTQLFEVEVIGNIHDNPELLEGEESARKDDDK